MTSYTTFAAIDSGISALLLVLLAVLLCALTLVLPWASVRRRG